LTNRLVHIPMEARYAWVSTGNQKSSHTMAAFFFWLRSISL
jgi:hypothetical protein